MPFRFLLLILWNSVCFLFIIWCISTVLRKYIGLTLIGLTGGIATGKSTCSNYLKSKHHRSIVDLDEITHHCYACGRKAWTKIRAEFGDEILHKDWTIDRQKLGEIVWKDVSKLRKLERVCIVRWPILQDLMMELLNQYLFIQCKVCILDIPLLIESRYSNFLYYLCDEVVLVWCDKKTQLQRLCQRDKITSEQAMLKITKQISIDLKQRYADVIINNNSNSSTGNVQDEMRKQVDEWIRKYNAPLTWKHARKPTRLSFCVPRS
ncbi:hypothetical protein RFI_10453 [Reticulomyxa filosa]|uniref:Dephospho-CoA kinase n=1 Tax=Reticulomyxa filosa TaxID=46433 RepID=X6NL86_RETFI|nr:hypothetical protein RFI_10453 [Reticulomyxa filosa]|eukprot:ETO26678.1 hypothetical protein RFI_10453 [Reticulomyxa filosa]